MTVSIEEYKETLQCPHCRKQNTIKEGFTDLNPDGENIYRLRSCTACGCEWEESYHLNSFTVRTEPKPKYNHVFSILFSLDSPFDADDIDKIPAEELKKALLKRIETLEKSAIPEWHEAVGYPEDTYENA